MKGQVFKVHREKFIGVLTKIALALIFFAIVMFLYAMIVEPDSIYVMLFFLAVTIFVPLYCYLMTPKCVELTNEALVLHRVKGTVVFRYSDIGKIEAYHKSGGLRLCGSGGLFGYIGIFSNTDIGRHYEYVCDVNEAFLIVLISGKKYMLSCDDSETVIRLVSERLSGGSYCSRLGKNEEQK